MVTLLSRTAQCLAKAGIEDAEFDAAQLILTASGKDARVFPDLQLTRQETEKLNSLCEQRCRRVPLQYLCGEWDFYDLTLKVGPGVLIPRPDTEIAAEEAIRAGRAAGEHPSVCDLCSGTGAIALCAARHVKGAQVTAVELSGDALEYLAENNRRYGSPLKIVKADVLRWQEQCGAEQFDVIVSNPPYVSGKEMETLEPELSYEPRMALSDESDGLTFYRHIAPAYFGALKKGGMLIFEIGWKQAQAVEEICRAAGYEQVRLLYDFGGNPRCVTARRPFAI